MVQHTYRAHDLISHPKFLEHLGERKDISAQDTRYAQTRVEHNFLEVLSLP
jgi:hypothetical protein